MSREADYRYSPGIKTAKVSSVAAAGSYYVSFDGGVTSTGPIGSGDTRTYIVNDCVTIISPLGSRQGMQIIGSAATQS